jgi:hypothetical protein
VLLNSLLEKGMPELFSGDTIGSVSILLMNRSNFRVIGNLLPGPAIFDLSSILEFYNSLFGMTESIFFYGMSYLTNSANALSYISSRSAFWLIFVYLLIIMLVLETCLVGISSCLCNSLSCFFVIRRDGFSIRMRGITFIRTGWYLNWWFWGNFNKFMVRNSFKLITLFFRFFSS